MGLMEFMELMGTSEIAIVASFFIGLMMAISPCPLATNITAIAFVSKNITNKFKTLMIGFSYTLGRMFTYVLIASMIVYFGLNTQQISLFLQAYGEMFLGPLMIIIGLIFLQLIKLNFIKGNSKFIEDLKLKLSTKGYIGSFLLGVIFALAFCPFSAVLFFGMLIPLALKAGDGIIIPAVFSLATGLPVIIMSIMLVYSVSSLGKVMNKIQTFERYTRMIIGIIFIIVGIYYVLRLFGIF
ncbi:MAG: aromatic aminobenezylarsenical efflux permease ArsG family transporter [Nanoarchaeota archaeon]